jgi:cephalosporin hydroxylase
MIIKNDVKYIRNKFIPKQRKKKFFLRTISYINHLLSTKYVYNFDWFGIPIIQFPSDIIAIQEVIFKYKPDIVIETGVAYGGSLIYYSSLLTLLGRKFKKIIGIDIFFRNKNLKILKNHPLFKNISLFKSSSIDNDLHKKLLRITKNKKVIVVLDSNHTEKHVLEELNKYSKYIKKNGYIIVLDTVIEFIRPSLNDPDRGFKKGNNPYTAIKKFLKKNKNFKIETYYTNKSAISSAYGGFLKRI